jgi:Mrp family chromosome partitioning ATPase
MSSMNQEFVTAFARRDQARQSVARSNQTAPRTTATNEEIGSLTLDPSVADTAQLWVDAAESQIARTDIAQTDPPEPHLRSQAEPAAEPHDLGLGSLPHMHTEYATAFPLAPTTPAAEPTAMPEPTATMEPTAMPEPTAEVEAAATARSIATATPTIVEEPAAKTAPPVAARPTSAAVSPPRMDAQSVVAEQPTIANRIYTKGPGVEHPAAANVWPPQPAPATDFTRMRVDDPVGRTSAPPIGGLHSITPFDAAWEVDVFDIPPCVADLFFEGALFQQITDRMSEAVSTGLKSLLVTSTKPREGRTSAAIGIAMAAGAAGIRVALVDADTETPTLADDLRLDLQYGWVDTIRGGLPIKEVAVNAIEDGVTLIPLMPPYGRTGATADEVIRLIDLLKSKFELIILDGPSGRSSNLHPLVTLVDSAVIVRDVRRTDTTDINEFSYRLHECGVSGVGVVENFA